MMAESNGTAELVQQLEAAEAEARGTIAAAQTTDEVEAARIRYLGRKEGQLTSVMRSLGQIAPEERPTVGAVLNRVKDAITTLLDERANTIAAAKAQGAGIDLTLPGRRAWIGARHPVTIV